MTPNRKLPLLVSLAVGAGVGAALANGLSNHTLSAADQTPVNGIVDTSGVCTYDYCGCFEDLSRSRVLTDLASQRELPDLPAQRATNQ